MSKWIRLNGKRIELQPCDIGKTGRLHQRFAFFLSNHCNWIHSIHKSMFYFD
ncbi:hypothetical protein [Thermoactinomyces vulgaris]|uniref:hypothetical protein n=1 Tax=Thermoactinomyces vulgaris TaxID=2026 RepID=UPI000ABCCD4E|nr:hypothetical protein [Thermoactinomyces vulgaris]